MLEYLLDCLRMWRAASEPPHTFPPLSYFRPPIPTHRAVWRDEAVVDMCATGHAPIPTGYTVCVNGVLIERQLCQRCGEVVEVQVKEKP
jgi:hypothetical protein